jgi:hypothetical protein
MSFPVGESDKDTLAQLEDEDGDQAETDYYEQAADPIRLAIESAQRRYRGMLRQRLRHLRRASQEG